MFRFGGNLARMRSSIYRRGAAFNWQLNCRGVAAFLRKIEPHLVLKKSQAEIAIRWQAQRPPPARDARGRMAPFPKDQVIDLGTARLLEALKVGSLDEVLKEHGDLTSIVEALRGVVCVEASAVQA